jgi:predicted metalloprotease with PDZ domain
MHTTPSTLHHAVRPLDLNAHLFEVVLTIPRPTTGLVLNLPVWIPGSYLVREFAQHVQHISAHLEGQPVALRQLDKHRWQVGTLPSLGTPVQPSGPPDQGLATPQPSVPPTPPAAASPPVLQVRFEVYARDASVRTAWLDAERGFFNGTSLCLAVEGREDQPHTLSIAPPALTPIWPPVPGPLAPTGCLPLVAAPWQVATALQPVHTDNHGFGTYQAPSYAALVDEPVTLGAFWSGQFEVRGVPHRFVVTGAGASFDGERLLADTRRICEAQMHFWHGATGQPPFDRYVFMLHASHDGHGGLEHPHSTALMCPRSHLPRRTGSTAVGGSEAPPALTDTDPYTSLLGLISHEYFHAWNVKRMRPAEFTRMDFSRENHTELLWLFEGFTSYFDDLMLLRAGLIGTEAYLALLVKTIQQVAHTPGQHVQTVAQASFDAWTRYYRVQENTPNATVSYYTKGALVALCLDLTLRQHGSSLDHAMRALWTRSQGGPITEYDVRAVATALAARPLDAELDAWVHSATELPTLALLAASGVSVTPQAPPLAQRLGLKVREDGRLTVQSVLRGGLAEQAGMAAGDEWLAVGTTSSEHWRIDRLDDIPPLLDGAAASTPLTALVSRDRRLLALPLQWPATTTPNAHTGSVRLSLPATATNEPAHPGTRPPASPWPHPVL